MFEAFVLLLAVVALGVVFGLFALVGTIVAGAFKLTLKAVTIPFVAAGFLLKGLAWIVGGLVLAAISLPILLGVGITVAIPVLLFVGCVWGAKKFVDVVA